MKKLISRLWSDESGASSVEYGLLVALIAIVIIVAVTKLGTELSTKFDQVADSIQGAGNN